MNINDFKNLDGYNSIYSDSELKRAIAIAKAFEYLGIGLGGNGGGSGGGSSINEGDIISAIESSSNINDISDKIGISNANEADSINILLQILNKIFVDNSAQKLLTLSSIKSNSIIWKDDFSGSALSSDWQIILGSGQSINISNSNLIINAGTNANSESILFLNKSFKLPLKISINFNISQRISNQNIIFQIIDIEGLNSAEIILKNTSNNAFLKNTNNGQQSGEISGSFFGTNTFNICEFEINPSESIYYYRSINSSNQRNFGATLFQRIPDISKQYYLRIIIRNLSPSPSSNTSINIDSILIKELEYIPIDLPAQIGGSNNFKSLPVIVNSGSLSISSGNISSQTNTNSIIVANSPRAANEVLLSTYDARNFSSLRGFIDTDQAGSLEILQGANSTLANMRRCSPIITCNPGLTVFDEKLYGGYISLRYTNGPINQESFLFTATLRS